MLNISRPLFLSNPTKGARSTHPQLPPKLPYLTTSNLHAAATNGYVDMWIYGWAESEGEPAKFYRDYHGVQQSRKGYTDTTSATNRMAIIDSMPASPSLRSNGNGNTPKQLHIPARGIKTSCRSVSSLFEAPLSSRRSSIHKGNGLHIKHILEHSMQ